VKAVTRPAARPRAILYLRQSTYREESISLELQEHEGRAYAERRGYDVVAVEADPGISGRTWNRPAVQRVMSAIEDGSADVIVLWKWSRLSRSRLDWAVAADRVATAGGLIESATEPLDTTTSTGRLARGMLTEFAAFESERIGDVWKESHARRIRNGLPANGKPRFGYVYSREEGFTPDPVTGPILASAFRSYIAGQSMYALVKELNSGVSRPVSGYGPVGDGLWSDRTLRRVMDSGFAAGFISSGGELLPGAHEALISDEEWTAYRAAREKRRVYRRVERSEYLLSGLVRCVCGSRMNAGQFGAQHVAKYRCKAGHEKRTHAGGYVTASLLEAFVFEAVAEYEADARAAVAEALANGPKVRSVKDPTATLRRQLAATIAKVDALGARAVELDMPKESYQRQLAPLLERQEALRAELLQVEARAGRREITILPGVIERWADIPIPERREMLRALFQYVEVTPGRPKATFRIVPHEGDNTH